MTRQENNKLSSVEGVRGLACFMVLLSHLSSIFFPYLHGQHEELIRSSFDALLFKLPLGFMYSGTGAVYIFFCLSGYILTYACASKGDVPTNAAKMFSARYLRLAIPTFVSIVICYIVLVIFPNNSEGMSWISGWGSGIDLSLFSALRNAIFSSVFLGDASYNWVVWTMQLELFGSFVIFFSISVIDNIYYKKTIYLILAFLIGINFPTKFGFGYSAFLIGAFIYYMPSIKNRFLSYLILLIGLYLCGYHYKQSFYSWLSVFETGYLKSINVSGSFLYLMLSGCALVFVALKSNILNAITSNKVSVWMGKMSFSAYLLQMPVFFLISPISLTIRNAFSIGYTLSAFITSAICLTVIYVLAVIFQRTVDAKSVTMSKYMINVLVKK